MALLMTSLFLLLCASPVVGLPNGPPESACVSMRPGTQVGVIGLDGHTTLPQNLQASTSRTLPFYIDVKLDRDYYLPGEEIDVHIMANQTKGLNRYKGVLMQARQLHCASNQTIPVYTEVEDEPLGSFLLPGGIRETLIQTMTCLGLPDSAVSHRSPQFKVDEKVTWRVPINQRGYVVFRATFVDETTIYWTDVHSMVLRENFASHVPICGATCLQKSWLLLLPLFVLFIRNS